MRIFYNKFMQRFETEDAIICLDFSGRWYMACPFVHLKPESIVKIVTK